MNELSNVFNQELQKLHNLKNEQISTISTEIEENQVTEKLMTTKELASVLGVSERTIRDTAKNKGVEGTFHTLKTKGGTQSVKVYTEEQATLIKQEIQKHHNLATRQIDSVSTQVEENQIVMKAMSILQNRNNELMAQLNNMQPKADYYDKFIDSTNLIEIGHLGKSTGIGEQKIFKRLVAEGYIKVRYSTDEVKYYDPCYGFEKYFKSVSVPFLRGEKQLNREKLMLTSDGYAYFMKKMGGLEKKNERITN